MRTLILVLISLLSYSSIAKQVKGYIVNKGDTTEVILFIKFVLGEPSLTGNYEAINFKYKEKDSRVLKLEARKDLQVGFNYKDEDYTFICLQEYDWVGDSKCGFVKLNYQGKNLMVVDAVKVDHSSDHFPMAHKNHSIVETLYSPKKGYLNVEGLGFKKRVKEYFADCFKAQELILENGLYRVDFKEVVDVYDDCLNSDD